MAVDKFPVESGHVMMFARSIGDANKIYYDEDYAKSTDQGAIIAPPTFVQSSAQFDPDYFLRPKVGEEWFGSAKGPTGITKKKEGGGGGGGNGGRIRYEDVNANNYNPPSYYKWFVVAQPLDNAQDGGVRIQWGAGDYP